MSSRPSEPPAGTVERWCWELIHTDRLERKLAPPAPPDVSAAGAWEADPPARRVERPGRPPELRVVNRSARTPDSLRSPLARARLLHTFLHHELQAAELFAWAVLAFPETPRAFRAGLVRLCREELEHLALYRAHLERLGQAVGDFPVRDWFWQRVGATQDAATFVALQGLGFEGANLEHSARFRERFEAAGDHAGARILARVERDEIGHVAFAARWFERLSGGPLDYERWRAALPPPLTPAVLRGRPLNRAARRRAGLDESFLARLEAEPPTTAGRRA
jgi:uncharacterized ferritin-like protein (DUF455 family)